MLTKGFAVAKTRTIANEQRRRPTYEEVAHLIAGNEPPPWLAPHLRWLEQSLSYDRRLAKIQTNRPEMIKRLQELRSAARLILQRTNGPVDRLFLEQNGGHRVSLRALEELAIATEATEASLTPSNRQSNRGRPTSELGPAMSAKTLFIARFSEIWAHFRDCEPGSQDRDAAAAARAYWEASGGDQNASANPVSSWRHYFENVRDAGDTAYLRQVRDTTRIDLNQTARRGRPHWYLSAIN